jgi:hypothetical protein
VRLSSENRQQTHRWSASLLPPFLPSSSPQSHSYLLGPRNLMIRRLSQPLHFFPAWSWNGLPIVCCCDPHVLRFLSFSERVHRAPGRDRPSGTHLPARYSLESALPWPCEPVSFHSKATLHHQSIAPRCEESATAALRHSCRASF